MQSHYIFSDLHSVEIPQALIVSGKLSVKMPIIANLSAHALYHIPLTRSRPEASSLCSIVVSLHFVSANFRRVCRRSLVSDRMTFEVIIAVAHRGDESSFNCPFECFASAWRATSQSRVNLTRIVCSPNQDCRRTLSSFTVRNPLFHPF